MAKSRASKGLLLPPRAAPTESAARQEKWLADAEAGFVSPSSTNRQYYAVILRALWPEGHGIPGPTLSERDIRAAVDAYREANSQPPYKDVFRRVRELQGEEGFTAIRKEGTQYQLQSLEVGPKREPRTKLGRREWNRLREKHGYNCASCGDQEPDVNLSPDHKIPRSRGGSNEEDNLQPLCEQCNNAKSHACRGCTLKCHVCSWAFPDEYKPLLISDHNKELVRREADSRRMPQSDLVNVILRDYFNRNR